MKKEFTGIDRLLKNGFLPAQEWQNNLKLILSVPVTIRIKDKLKNKSTGLTRQGIKNNNRK